MQNSLAQTFSNTPEVHEIDALQQGLRASEMAKRVSQVELIAGVRTL